MKGALSKKSTALAKAEMSDRKRLIARILANFPKELLLLAQWVLWKLEPRGGKTTKVPYQVDGTNATTSNSDTWSSFDAVADAYIANPNFSGVGFVFSALDPFGGIDLDKCRDPETGEVQPWAKEVIDRMATYCELSPSGKGFHLIGKARLPPSGRRKGQIEMYDSGRYFTVTGNHYAGSAPTACEIQSELDALHREVFGTTSKRNKPKSTALAPRSSALQGPQTDNAIIEEILASHNAQAFLKFQAGDWQALGYPSQSEGDLALAGLLVKYAGPNAETIDRIFRTTGMYREKWDEMRGANTYGDITVEKAVQGRELDDAKGTFMSMMNQRFAVVVNGNQVKILDESDSGESFSLYSKSDFEMLTTNIESPMPKVSAARAWLSSTERREFRGLVFAPAQPASKSYNLWRGFSVEPRAGDCSLFWKLVLDGICAGSVTAYEYVRRYFAHMVQRPYERPEVALVLRGGQGTGKNTFVDTIGSLISKHYCSINNVEQLTGRFNGHMRNTILLHANEATWGGNKSEAGKLKAMITDATIPIELKGHDILHFDNHIRLVVSSNEDWPVPVEADDRRFLILDVAPTFKQNNQFFSDLHAQLENGGRQALMHDLVTEDITGFSPRAKPATPFGADMKLRTADSTTRWLYDCLNGNAWTCPGYGAAPIFAKSRASATYGKAEFYADYEKWIKSASDRFPMARDQFHRKLGTLLGSSMKITRPSAKAGHVRDRIVWLSSIEACRKAFAIAAGIDGSVVWDAV